MAKTNLTMVNDFAVKARELDFVSRFTRNWNALREIMGIMRPIEKEAGTVLKSYTATVTLENGAVAEGNEIPYSKASVSEATHEDLTLKKYAKAVSIEAVNTYGAEIAVQRTDDAFLNELQGVVMDDFYTFLQTGKLKSTESTLQMAISMAIGRVQDKFKKLHLDSTSVVVFANTIDIARYLGSASITLQTQNGIQYLQNFLGANTVIVTSEIPEGTVIATPVENIILYYVNPSNSDFARLGLNYTVEGETNLIGFHANGNYNTAVGESFALMGMKLWAEYLDAIAIVTIGATEASITFGEEKLTVAVGSTVTNTVTTVPANATLTWATSDSTIATVSSGTVTGVKKGRAFITATDATHGTSESFEVVVK